MKKRLMIVKTLMSNKSHLKFLRDADLVSLKIFLLSDNMSDWLSLTFIHILKLKNPMIFVRNNLHFLFELNKKTSLFSGDYHYDYLRNTSAP